MKSQITNHKYQINHNDQNSKSDSAESFDPGLTARGFVAGKAVYDEEFNSASQCFGH